MSTKHTPGPYVNVSGSGSIQTKGGETIARVDVEATDTLREFLANVNLFVAAPDLLEACEDAADTLGKIKNYSAIGTGGSMERRLRAAIAKAKGEA